MNYKWITRGLLVLVLFLAGQWGYLWYKGIEGNPFQTIVRTKVVKVLEPARLARGEERKIYPCVPIQAISNKDSKGDQNREDLQSPRDNAQNQEQPQSQTEIQLPDYPLLLERYRLETNLMKGSVLEVYLLENGRTEVRVAYVAPLLELGKLREVGLWSGPALGHSDLKQSLKFSLSYQQDLFRVGPSWSRLRMEGSYRTDGEFEGLVQIGFPILRF